MPLILYDAVLPEDIPAAWIQNQLQMQKSGHQSASVSPGDSQQMLPLEYKMSAKK